MGGESLVIVTTIHLPALYHTITSDDYSHCAFTGKVLRFSKMMCAQGFDVIEYGNEGSESQATEHVVLRSRARFDELHPRTGFVGEGTQVKIGSESHLEFHAALIRELRTRVKPGDIIAHPLQNHKSLVQLFPSLVHVETGIGYTAGPFGAYRIFETETWRHWHFGRYWTETCDPVAGQQSWVAPNYYDLEDWPLGAGKGGYFAFMARKCHAKGLRVLAEIINAYDGPHHFRIAGQGEEWSDWKDFCLAIGCYRAIPSGAAFENEHHVNVFNVGELRGRERAKFLGDAVALLCPTQFVEPFGGASIEAMLCGTPAIGSAWGAYTETLPEWARCKTVDQWLGAMQKSALLHGVSAEYRQARQMLTRNAFSLDSVGKTYANIFAEILSLRGKRRAKT